MNPALAAAGALPALAAMWYVDRLDAKRPEPRSSLRRVAVAGALMALPAVAAEFLILKNVELHSAVGAILFVSFVVAASVEELSKVITVRVFIWDAPEFDERMDGIVYGTRAGLGFALVENVYYLLNVTDGQTFIYLFLARALLVIPGHATWAGIMGYCAARRRFDKVGPGFVGGYLIAVVLHGAYDASVFALPLAWQSDRLLAYPLLAAPVVLIVGGVVVLRRLARKALALDDAAEAAFGAPGQPLTYDASS